MDTPNRIKFPVKKLLILRTLPKAKQIYYSFQKFWKLWFGKQFRKALLEFVKIKTYYSDGTREKIDFISLCSKCKFHLSKTKIYIKRFFSLFSLFLKISKLFSLALSQFLRFIVVGACLILLPYQASIFTKEYLSFKSQFNLQLRQPDHSDIPSVSLCRVNPTHVCTEVPW